MHRRSFLKDAAITAVAIGSTGFIHFNGKKFVGDCETTTDILGPFYRPASPVRTNLVIDGEPGKRILLAGKVKHNDCTTPFANAKIEIWHCSAAGDYDNTSNEFRYRATTFSDQKGNYHFTTILPVPYNVGNGNVRPAHFHLMITAKGYQPLVTQLYFKGDRHISTDRYSSSAAAKRRILSVESLTDNSYKVNYDINLSTKVAAETAVLHRLAGKYLTEDESSTIDFFVKDGQLWVENDLFENNLEYIGNNSFQAGRNSNVYQFEIINNGQIKVAVNNPSRLKEDIEIAFKFSS